MPTREMRDVGNRFRFDQDVKETQWNNVVPKRLARLTRLTRPFGDTRASSVKVESELRNHEYSQTAV